MKVTSRGSRTPMGPWEIQAPCLRLAPSPKNKDPERPHIFIASQCLREPGSRTLETALTL